MMSTRRQYRYRVYLPRLLRFTPDKPRLRDAHQPLADNSVLLAGRRVQKIFTDPEAPRYGIAALCGMGRFLLGWKQQGWEKKLRAHRWSKGLYRASDGY